MIVTIAWLERYLLIKEEIEDLRNRLKAVDGWKSPRLSPNPAHTESHEGLDPIVIRRDRVHKKYLEKIREGYELMLEIETFIEEVPDPLTRTIIRLKYVDGLSWREVGDAVGLYYSACYRRVEQAIKNSNKSNSEV